MYIYVCLLILFTNTGISCQILCFPNSTHTRDFPYHPEQLWLRLGIVGACPAVPSLDVQHLLWPASPVANELYTEEIILSIH